MTIQVDNPSILTSLKKILGAIDGVTIVKSAKVKSKETDITKTAGYKEAMADKDNGRVSGPFHTSEELFNHLGI